MTIKQLFRYIIYFFIILLILGNIQTGVINGYLILFLTLGLLLLPTTKFIYGKYKERKYLKLMSKAGIHEIDKMDGYQFEAYLRALFKELGYKSAVTQGSGDFGADLVMKNDNKKVVVQAKRYGYKNKVSLGAVQEIYSSMPYYKADQGIVVTNSYYTESAVKLAKACKIRLIDRKDLIYFINQVNPAFDASQIRQNVEPEHRRCPNCSGELLQRISNSGSSFMGCTNFPDCQYTENVAK